MLFAQQNLFFCSPFMNANDSTFWLHLRLPDFAVQVEEQLNPALRRCPFALCTSLDGHGRVLALSPAVELPGFRKGHSVGELRRRSGEVECLPFQPARLRAVHTRVLQLLQERVPAVSASGSTGFSIALAGCRHLFASAGDLGLELRSLLSSREGLHSAIGLASSALGARLIARRAEAGEICALEEEEVQKLLDSFPLTWLPGVGGLREELAELGLHLIGDARLLDPAWLRRVCGDRARLLLRSLGELEPGPRLRSLQVARLQVKDAHKAATHKTPLRVERSLPVAQSDPGALWQELFGLLDEAAQRLHALDLEARRLLLAVEWDDGRVLLRGAPVLREPGDSALAALRHCGRGLLSRALDSRRLRVRALKVELGSLSQAPHTVDLFAAAQQEKLQRLESSLGGIRSRYGGSSIRRGICGGAES